MVAGLGPAVGIRSLSSLSHAEGVARLASEITLSGIDGAPALGAGAMMRG